MKLHELKPKFKKKKKKRKGRGVGSGKGTYAGRGIKGQKARSGYRIPPSPLIRRLPKLRGQGFRKVKREKPSIVNLRDLEKKYKVGEEVSLKTLKEKGLIDKKAKKVKILGQGELRKKLKFEKGILFSQRVKSIIESKGKSKSKLAQ